MADKFKAINDKDINAKKSYIAIVLDKSGSMLDHKQTTISGFNEQVQTIKKNATNDTYVSLVLFNDSIEIPFFNSNVSSLNEMNEKTYNPDASTSLYDAVGKILDRFKKETDWENENNIYLISIITDGEENSSKEYKNKQIAKMIKELQDTKRWTFTYLGPNNVNLTKINKELNIELGNMKAYVDSTDGRYLALHMHSQCLASYMNNSKNSNVKCSNNFYLDSNANDLLERKEVKDEDLQQV